MLSLIERQTGSQPISASSSRPNDVTVPSVAPSSSSSSSRHHNEDDQHHSSSPSSKKRKNHEKKSSSSSSSDEQHPHQEQHSHHHDSNDSPLQPWGYNKDRNVPRWKAIQASIEKDLHDNDNNHNFVLVDYGSDQGFFSISASHHFGKRGAFVVSVELGGVGGEIWKKKVDEGNDVLSIQERMSKKYHADKTMMICQTKISPDMFFSLVEHNQTHRYQFVLSVFHWFYLPTRKDFEAAIVALFRNAQSTFIELPTIGDRSLLIRKQVGWTYFEKWYDGRSDIRQIILDAAQAHDFPVKVTKVVSVPWLKWTRDMYRVDWDLSSSSSSSSPHLSFKCDERMKVWGCNRKREKLNECHDVV